jgi:hypothetical protein
MQLTRRVWILLTLGVGSGGTVFSQQLAFTSRTYVQSPVVIASVQPSEEFGFGSVVIRNDGPNAIAAVHFQIAFHSAAGDEIADERRVAVNIEPRDSKRLIVDLAHIEGLKQLARSREQTSALVILTIESIEFREGGEWKETEKDRGTPIDPAVPVKISPRK